MWHHLAQYSNITFDVVQVHNCNVNNTVVLYKIRSNIEWMWFTHGTHVREQ